MLTPTGRMIGMALGRHKMAAEFDCVIRGGTVVDGTGREPLVADVAIRDGKVVQVGSFAGSGKEEIDAT
jgi:N-acyl-D-amino-acid deacylase